MCESVHSMLSFAKKLTITETNSYQGKIMLKIFAIPMLAAYSSLAFAGAEIGYDTNAPYDLGLKNEEEFFQEEIYEQPASSPVKTFRILYVRLSGKEEVATRRYPGTKPNCYADDDITCDNSKYDYTETVRITVTFDVLNSTQYGDGNNTVTFDLPLKSEAFTDKKGVYHPSVMLYTDGELQILKKGDLEEKAQLVGIDWNHFIKDTVSFDEANSIPCADNPEYYCYTAYRPSKTPKIHLWAFKKSAMLSPRQYK